MLLGSLEKSLGYMPPCSYKLAIILMSDETCAMEERMQPRETESICMENSTELLSLALDK